jgi:hypothetical protein
MDEVARLALARCALISRLQDHKVFERIQSFFWRLAHLVVPHGHLHHLKAFAVSLGLVSTNNTGQAMAAMASKPFV